MTDEAPKPALNPAALSITDVARVLTAASGQRVTEAMIEADVADGAPLNPDGSMNVVRYGAWLARLARA